ncbi:ATP-binding cassette domain-containing protein [Virgibacillus halophilus]|uniref:ATP-binding cassette domain-containing protein n=1 Tax=Tigheibacillus halophilus TaxID=361280 RepID=A0ABU5CA57_9BACI|nr:ATP-binding cassette domain-containing protein [Virgibacillus halophilus]
MSAYKTSTIASLSGGQKQKLALACILAMEPALLVLDEPTANLDPVATNEVLQIIKKLQQKTNCSLIVIEHHLDGWTDIASRCVLLNKSGTIFFDGNLKDAVLTHHRQLKEEGIWLPKITQYFIQHAQEHLDCLPFTLEDFAAQAAPIQLPLPEINMVQHHMASEVLLSAKDLSWSVKQKQIVQHASLSIREGGVYRCHRSQWQWKNLTFPDHCWYPETIIRRNIRWGKALKKLENNKSSGTYRLCFSKS